jgi:Lrp/AsnC family leucine-responsive transcriptional regulator
MFHLYVFVSHKKLNRCNDSGVTANAVTFLREGGAVSTRKRGYDLDKYDVAILSALATNARLSTVELATMVHLSRTAVSRRISSLKKARVLNEAAEVLNYKSLGFGVRAVVEIRLPSHAAEALRKRLLVQPEVLSVSVIAGDGLLCLDVIAVDMNHLHSFIHTLQRSGETSLKIVYAEDKSQLTLVQRMRMLNKHDSDGLVRA